MNGRGALFLSFLLIGLVAGAAAERAPSDPTSIPLTLEQVVAWLKDEREPSVPFEEQTYSSMLTEPLIVRGVLRFTPPSTLEKEVVEPYHEQYIFDGDRVTFESERKHIKKTLSLHDYPALRSFADAFRASFTGDVALLTQVYETTVDGTRGKWTLLLRPHNRAGNNLVDYILLSGSEGRIATIAIRSPDGDRSVITLRRGPSR